MFEPFTVRLVYTTMKTYTIGLTRQGTCICGEPVYKHFDDRNVKHDCETVKQLRKDEEAHEYNN